MPDLHDLHGTHVWKRVEKDPRVGTEEMDADDQMVEGVVEEATGKEADRHVERLELEKDECLETIFCEGDCRNISQLSCKTSTDVWSLVMLNYI